MLLCYLIVTGATHYYIIIIVRTAFYGFTVGNTEGSIMGTKKYLIIKKTLFPLKQKFATTGDKKKHVEELNIYKKKWPQY